jgi:hypothetical protein
VSKLAEVFAAEVVEVAELRIHGNASFHLVILSGPFEAASGQVIRRYELAFEQFEGYALSLDSMPWISISGFEQLRGEDARAVAMAVPKRGYNWQGADLYRFRCEEGTIEVYAHGHKLRLLEVLAYFGKIPPQHA